MNVAINGFGRIGRATFKALLDNKNINIVAINDLTDLSNLVHLLKYDSVYGVYDKKVRRSSHHLYVDGKKFKVLAERDPSNLPWKELGVDVVLECTGFFRTEETAGKHLEAGAKKVIISAHAKGDEGIKNIVLGVNENEIKKSDKIISMASCTTNCLAPVTSVIKKKFGIKKAIMTTIHSYTSSQNIVDGPHKDLRRGRAAAINIVPTTTGAAIATTKTIPSLKGKFDGMAVRTPTPVGSLCDIVFSISKKVTEKDINKALTKASKTSKLRGILEVTNDPIVLSDIVGNPASSIVDLELTKVVDGDLVKIISWYDNEWGYSNRMADTADYLRKKKLV
ncbi:type I glyceraldehyde-3-phosphate dehydrogenase [bacterium]|nr:type I glyceraldehyde-3-phosphate dehydrogenase [bacterium]